MLFDNSWIKLLRLSTPGQRFAIAMGITQFVTDRLRLLVRAEHPEWDRGQINREAARRLEGLANDLTAPIP